MRIDKEGLVMWQEGDIINSTNSRADIIALLKKGGLTPEDIDKGDKTFEDLCKEILERDVTLSWDEELQRVVRFAFSSKLLIFSPQGVLLEIRREYPHSGRVIKKTQAWSISETQRRDEKPIEAAIRGAKDELGITIPESEVTSQTIYGNHDLHESSVYRGILSRVVVRYFIWSTDQLLKKRFRPVKDNNVVVAVSWFQGMPKELLEKLLVKLSKTDAGYAPPSSLGHFNDRSSSSASAKQMTSGFVLL